MGFRCPFIAIPVRLTQTLSVLLNASEASSSSSSDSFTGSTSFGEKEEYITLLSSLGRAVAAGAEAGENLDDISAGSLGLKVTHVRYCTDAGPFAASNVAVIANCFVPKRV